MPGGKRTLNSDGKFINNKSEKTSVSAIVAQNNETLSKLISGEITKVGFSGKTASTLKSDVNVNASLYEIDNPLTSDDESEVPKFIENNLSTTLTQETVNSESFANTFPTFDENSNGLFVVGTQPDANVNASLYEKDNSLTLDDESEIPSFQAHQDLASATPLIDAEKQRIAQQSPTADGPFDKSLPPGGRDLTHSDAYLENEKAVTAALKNDANELMIAKHNVTHGTNYLKPIPVDVSDINSGTAYRSMHTDMDELKASERFADGGSESYYFETQDDDGNDISVLIENESEEKLYGVDAENLFLQNSKDGLIVPEREGIGFTVDEITSRAIAEAKVKGLEERKTMTAAEIDLISESISEKSRRLVSEEAEKGFRGDSIVEGPGERAAYLQNELEKEKGRNPKNRFDSLREKQKLEQEKKAEKERLTELHNQQINNPTADDIAGESQLAKDKAALRKQMQENAQRTLGNDSAFANPVEKTKIPDKYPTMGDKLGNSDLLVGKDPFRFSTLAYPMNITVDEEYGHYMLFYVNVQNKTGYKYLGYNDDDNLAIIGDVVESQTYTSDTGTSDSITETTSAVPEDRKYKTNYHYNTGANNEAVAYHKQSYLTGKKGNFLQSNQVTLKRQRKATAGLAAAVPTTSRITDSVAIYLPADVKSDVQATYQGSEMGLLGFLALGGAGVINQIKERDFEGAADNFLGMGERALSEMIKKAGIAAVDTAFNVGGATEGVFNKIFGQTPNPFLEVAFQNLGLRQFNYTFNFKPRSAEETEEVKAIIQLFRFHMAPELRGTNHRYMTLPSTFDIHYMYQSNPESATENTFYNKIATCVLEGCDVDYTPTGVKSFESGAPTEITMALKFKETELLTKQKINKGF
jgi:hypothetical protein